MTADHDRRWLALAVIGVAQLMIILDSSIVNIALPDAQTALHISNAARPGYIWVPGHYEARGADRRWVNGHFIPTGQPRAITALEADRAEMKSAMANDLDSFHDRHGVLMMTSREPYPVTASNR